MQGSVACDLEGFGDLVSMSVGSCSWRMHKLYYSPSILLSRCDIKLGYQ